MLKFGCSVATKLLFFHKRNNNKICGIVVDIFEIIKLKCRIYIKSFADKNLLALKPVLCILLIIHHTDERKQDH